ncbi:thioredoxin family protein [Aureibaculum sp. 2210JD6-5]|uniref:thioredoxin family protein n=1 Tax=Aureibaculum sp. 2210JD6-5 TaxID=3103957 RepID=UPI002AAD2FD9|nr:thioredoxin family protein [Aureibaculum sp. 2210JD6-5]MDY7396694.1 thioredoxin family protein [Aureibaculum sp. 2210JD6-5]
MNKIFYILFLTLSCSFGINAQNKKPIDLNWQTDFEKAKELATSETKHILIYFTGYDRSDSCQMLNEDFFYTEKFQKIANQHLILVRVNEPIRQNAISDDQKKKNNVLSKKFNQKVHPTVVLCSADGELISMIESYNYLRDTSKHYALLEKVIKK